MTSTLVLCIFLVICPPFVIIYAEIHWYDCDLLSNVPLLQLIA